MNFSYMTAKQMKSTHRYCHWFIMYDQLSNFFPCVTIVQEFNSIHSYLFKSSIIFSSLLQFQNKESDTTHSFFNCLISQMANQLVAKGGQLFHKINTHCSMIFFLIQEHQFKGVCEGSLFFSLFILNLLKYIGNDQGILIFYKCK